MELESQADIVVDSVQLRRIEATHRGFLYQHLYGVACVLMSGRSGWSRLMIEFNEDVELRYPDRHVYVQVKTRSRLVKPGDVASALQRFERYREIHDSAETQGSRGVRTGAELRSFPCTFRMYCRW